MQGRLTFTIAAVFGLVLLVQSSPLVKERRDSSFSQGQRTQVIGPSGSIVQETNQNDAASASAPVEVPVSLSVPRPVVVASAPVSSAVVHESYEYEVAPAAVHYTYRRPSVKVSSKLVSDVVAPAPVVAVPAAVPAGGNGGAGIGYVGDVSGGNVVGIGGDAGR